MSTLFLKFASESEARAVLFKTVGAVEADPEHGIEAKPVVEVLSYRNTDIIGTIYEPTGETQEGPQGQVPVMAPLDGYHANVYPDPQFEEDYSALEPYRVYPQTATRDVAR